MIRNLSLGLPLAAAVVAGTWALSVQAQNDTAATLEVQSSGTQFAQQAALSPDDIANVTRAEDYLNALDSFQARFVQLSSNGAYAEGKVYVERPGNMRFEYDPPHPALLIANGSTLLYYDRELKEATFLPLWETPLWFLIREEVEIGDDLKVTKVEEALSVLRITLEDQDNPDRGEVTLVFADNPMVLKKWEIKDPQGITTQVSLIEPQYGVAIDDDVFDYGDLEIANKPQRKVDQ